MSDGMRLVVTTYLIALHRRYCRAGFVGPLRVFVWACGAIALVIAWRAANGVQ